MLNNQTTQGIQFGRITNPSTKNDLNLNSNLKLDLEMLFSAQAKVQACIQKNLNLYELNFAQENNSRIDASQWLELQNELLNIEQDLLAAFKQAKYLLTDNKPTTTNLTNELITNWSTHPKRAVLLELLNNSHTSPDLIESIDEAFLEDSKAMLGFSSPVLCTDLLALLEEQVKDFSKLTKAFELAVTSEKQEEILRKLLGDPMNPDDALFDIFTSGLSSINDFEVSFTVIATYLVVCA